MSYDLDPHLQRVIDSAVGHSAQDSPELVFNFPAIDPRNAERSFRPAGRPPLQEDMLLPNFSRNFQTHESSHQLLAAPSPNSNRLSLVSRSIYHQQERQPRAITNADHHFRFAQNLRQGLPVNRVAPAINQIGIQSPLSKLATDMLLQRPVPYVTAEPVALLQGLQPTNQMQSRRQHITPPFNLGGFIYSPTALQNSRSSSSPAVQHSSPTVRVNVRRLSNRPGHSSGHVEDGHVLDKDTAPPETPRQHEAPVETPFTERAPQALALNHAPPMAHGIQLVSPHELPDRFRQIFPYELFNAAQSKCFGPIYRRNDNVVVSAPTGSGKTAILELAICRLIEGHRSGEFKIVYQAPTKSLCSERMRDWQKKFSHLNLPCAELTGDTNHIEMNRVRGATIIITTIEKWDSITRQWHDHTKLLQLVKLFLIDEVHMLKDSRGATLEAVVSRMKSIGANVRFVALSATVPNAEDIALWLGKDPTNEHLPAHREIFGEDFRPVKLQKHVYGFEGQMNDFAFEKVLDGKLPNLIMKHTAKKPIMVFCFTRKSCESTAIMLAEWWTRQKVVDRAWPAPIQRLVVGSKELQDLVELGVAFHHAGLDPQDRNLVETAYLKGDISVICCTSTLAVGVNLPCHLIVLKGTVGFQDGGLCEYSDLEVMQMLGRAGRPQFDDSAVAVIMTRSDKVQRYKNMITGREVLESTLHLSLMEHLNSEIGLGTVYDLESARRWLSGTFLSVRMRQNPSYYKLEGISPSEDANKWLRMVCERDIRLLQDHQLVSEEDRFSCTSYGLAMSRYMVQFDTMKLLLSLPRHAKADQILQLISQASEFKDLRMKPNERVALREFNKSSFIKYPIKENISTTPQKIFLMVQVQLGGVDLPSNKDFLAIRRQFLVEKKVIFERIQRLIRCVIDCKSVDCDAISTRHALDLARSLAAEFWEYSNLQLRQIPQIGPAITRKLVANKVNSVESLANLDTASIERIMGRNPPFGRKILDLLRDFPSLTLASEIVGRAASRPGENPKVNIKVQLSFTNARTPLWNGRKPSLTFMAETSNGALVHLWRGNIQRLDKVQELQFVAEICSPDDEIKCHIACDDIVGTSRSSSLRPNIPASAFPVTKSIKHAKASSKRKARDEFDEFGCDDFEDNELLAAVKGADAPAHEYGSDGFADVDDSDEAVESSGLKRVKSDEVLEPVQMENGKWACNHPCRGGQALKTGQPCKHKCCHEGLDRPRKPRRKVNSSIENRESKSAKTQTKIVFGGKSSKKPFARNSDSTGAKIWSTKAENGNNTSSRYSKVTNGLILRELNETESEQDIEVIDLAEHLPPVSYADVAPREYRKLHSLHLNVQKDDGKAVRLLKAKPGFSYASGREPELPFLYEVKTCNELVDYEDSAQEGDLPSLSLLLEEKRGSNDPIRADHLRVEEPTPASTFVFDDPLESLEAAMAELEDPSRPRTPMPRVDSSFENGIFDFAAFSNRKDDKQELFSSPLMRESFKRQRSFTPELPQAKYPRVQSGETPMTTNESSSNNVGLVQPGDMQLRSTPAWVDEFDCELVNELKGIVDFVD